MRAAASYIYGAGNMGREVLAHWRTMGIEPKAFIDRAAGSLAVHDGVPILLPDAVAEPPASHVLVALHSPGVDVAAIVDDLARRGFGSVETLWSACEREDWLPALPYWLAPKSDWAAEAGAIAETRALFADDASRSLFDAQMRLRREGCYAFDQAPTREDQYFPDDLPRWREPMRLVDCGAYDGDTIRAAAAAGYQLERCVAFEPDPANFAVLTEVFGGDRTMRLVRAGVHSTSGTVSFAAGTGPSARIDATGAIAIPVQAIDRVCADFEPTLIKMDIEGAERDALEGARETLARCRPGLALSVYHRPDDLWRIPLWVAGRDLGYRFHLRSHGYCGFDTVLYAFAP